MMWWDGGHWYWGVVMMVVFWGSIVALAYLVVRGRAETEPDTSPSPKGT